jgi:phosphoribosylanthranilate isomerase
MTRSYVKICGITNRDDALLAEQEGADFIGLILTEKSPRRIAVDVAQSITKSLQKAKPIGVFWEQDADQTMQLAKSIGLYGIQHYRHFSQSFAPYFFLQAIGLEGHEDVRALMKGDPARPAPDAFLFDRRRGDKVGGTGEVFDWSCLPKESMNRIVLAGGLGPDNVATALALRPFAIDASSRLEQAPGIKDPVLLRQFFKEIRHAQQL